MLTAANNISYQGGQSRNHGFQYFQLIGRIYFERPESGNPCWHCCCNATVHHPHHRFRRCPCNASRYKRSSRHPCWPNNPYLRQLAGSRSIRRSTKAEYKLVAIRFSYICIELHRARPKRLTGCLSRIVNSTCMTLAIMATFSGIGD